MDLLQPAVCGRHAEYLLPLTSSCEPQLLQAGPTFQYVMPADENDSDACMDLEQFDLEEKVSTVSRLCLHSPLIIAEPDPGLCPLKRHQLRTCEVGLASESNLLHGFITQEVDEVDRPRGLWEVCCGGGRASDLAESFGMVVEKFDLSTGWDFNLLDKRVREEMPDEILFAPECKLYSRMQNRVAQTEQQRAQLLQESREEVASPIALEVLSRCLPNANQ